MFTPFYRKGATQRSTTLAGICQELGVSVSYILYGFDISAEQEEILKLLENASPEARAGMISLLLRGLQRP